MTSSQTNSGEAVCHGATVRRPSEVYRNRWVYSDIEGDDPEDVEAKLAMLDSGWDLVKKYVRRSVDAP